jgi:hypothetical protein
VILGTPGTPHLVLEFKKLDGSTDRQRHYCFDGMSRFVEGKYAVGHAHGIMCAFSPNDLDQETAMLSAYIADTGRASRLCCIADGAGQIITAPSQVDPISATFDTLHDRPSVGSGERILLTHSLLHCPWGKTPKPHSKAAKTYRTDMEESR